jgi:hypothetical protein
LATWFCLFFFVIFFCCFSGPSTNLIYMNCIFLFHVLEWNHLR